MASEKLYRDTLRDICNSGKEIFIKGAISRDTCLRELNVIKGSSFCSYEHNKGLSKVSKVCNIFHISHFHVCCPIVLQVYFLTYAKKDNIG